MQIKEVLKEYDGSWLGDLEISDLLQQFVMLKNENQALKEVNAVFVHDAKLIKDAFYKVSDMLGMVSPDGTFTDEVDSTKIMGVVGDFVLPKLPFQKKKPSPFAFLLDLLPHIQKYKDL